MPQWSCGSGAFPSTSFVCDGDVWTVVGCSMLSFGTIVSFNAYLEGVKRIGAVSGSILSSIEPISAAFFGWALLGNQFKWVGILGMAMIIATVIIIALEKTRSIILMINSL